MKKLRFLQCAYLPSINLSVNFNDEHEIADNLAETLVKQGIADELKPELNAKTNEKPTPKARKPRKKVAQVDE